MSESVNDMPHRGETPRPNRAGLFVGLLLVVAAGGFYAYVSRPVPTPAGWGEDFAAARDRAARDSLPMFVDFGASWCSPCQEMARDVLPAPVVAEALRGFIAVRVDVDKDRQTAATYQVEALPTFIVLNSAGREIYRFEGYRNVEEFVEQIRKARERLRGSG